jgi:predicted permease
MLYLPWIAFCAWLGALSGVCTAKLLKRPIEHTAIDAVLGVLGFVTGFFAFIKLMDPVNGDGAGPAGIVWMILFPTAHQGLRFLVAYARRPSN